MAYCKWSKAYWDYEERAIFNQWVEAKTNRVTPMCYFQDASNFEMCVIHSFACYLLLGGGSNHRHKISSAELRHDYIFPSLAAHLKNDYGGAAKAVNKYLSDLVQSNKVPGLCHSFGCAGTI